MKKMYTPWGESIDPDNLLLEYPRPNLVRDSYYNLNGYYRYRISKDKHYSSHFDGSILVPFSPESILSNVSCTLKPDEYLWYERDFTLPDNFKKDLVFIHFGAVDQICRLYINRQPVLTHVGGYLPFCADITKYLVEGSNTLTLCVRDLSETSYHQTGKQRLKRGGMFYSAQSGIWQSVWLESTPFNYVKDIKITPSYDTKTVDICVISDEECECTVSIYDGDTLLATKSGLCSGTFNFYIHDMKSWSPESPFLYDIDVRLGSDCIKSYFAMRKVSIGKDSAGHMRLMLNNSPYYQKGILDQGYWSDGLYTAPSDEAMIYDIKTAKSLGYNMIRKHVKIEPLRWYYHCDKIGMLVWQDMVNGGTFYHVPKLTYFLTLLPFKKSPIKDNNYRFFSRVGSNNRKQFIKELLEMTDLLYNFPCICTWVIFNEGWGQFDSNKITRLLKTRDSSRIIDSTSGWFSQGESDIVSAHTYFGPIVVRAHKKPFVLSEFGGYALNLKEHSYNGRVFGYKLFSSTNALKRAYSKLYNKKIERAKQDGLSASVYTQLSDVEEEVNGILTYDRRKNKLL